MDGHERNVFVRVFGGQRSNIQCYSYECSCASGKFIMSHTSVVYVARLWHCKCSTAWPLESNPLLDKAGAYPLVSPDFNISYLFYFLLNTVWFLFRVFLELLADLPVVLADVAFILADVAIIQSEHAVGQRHAELADVAELFTDVAVVQSDVAGECHGFCFGFYLQCLPSISFIVCRCHACYLPPGFAMPIRISCLIFIFPFGFNSLVNAVS